MGDDEVSVPMIEIFKVKKNSDGTLAKLKTCIVVCSDIQGKSTTASFRSLKIFSAHASHLKVRVKQLDFIGAILKAKIQSRMFMTLPKILGILFPECEKYCGATVQLQSPCMGLL
jgi:hypothetical protein